METKRFAHALGGIVRERCASALKRARYCWLSIGIVLLCYAPLRAETGLPLHPALDPEWVLDVEWPPDWRPGAPALTVRTNEFKHPSGQKTFPLQNVSLIQCVPLFSYPDVAGNDCFDWIVKVARDGSLSSEPPQIALNVTFGGSEFVVWDSSAAVIGDGQRSSVLAGSWNESSVEKRPTLVAASLDLRRVVVARESSTQLWDVNSESLVTRFEQRAHAVSFSATDRVALLWADPQSDLFTLVVVDSQGVEQGRITEPFSKNVRDPFLAPNGERLYYFVEESRGPEIAVLELGSMTRTFHQFPSLSRGAVSSFSEDGHFLAVRGGGVVSYHEVRQGDLVELWSKNEGYVASVAVSPRGNFVAYQVQRNAFHKTQLHVIDRSGTEIGASEQTMGIPSIGVQFLSETALLQGRSLCGLVMQTTQLSLFSLPEPAGR